MAEVKPTYIPQSNGMFFANAYLDSHRAKLEKSIAFAQAETQNQMALLEYYRKQEQAYLKYLAKVKGVKGFDDKTGAETLKIYNSVASMDQADNNARIRAFEKANKKYELDGSQISGIQAQTLTVVNNLATGTADGSAVDRAIAGAVKEKSNEKAMAAAIALYNAIKSEDAQRARPQFDDNENGIADLIVKQFGLVNNFGGFSPKALLRNQAEFEKIKQADTAREQAKATSRTKGARQSDVMGLLGQQPTSTGTGGQKVDTTYEELMLSRIQGRAAALEDQIQKATQAEAIMERGKEIYQNQYGGSLLEKLGRRKESKRIEERLNSMPPEERFFVESLEGAEGIANNNPFFYREDDDLKGDNKLAAELLNSMIANKGAAKPIGMDDFIQMAGKMATNADGSINSDQQKRVLGLALKGLKTFDREMNPAQYEADAAQAATLYQEAERQAKKSREERILAEAALAEQKQKSQVQQPVQPVQPAPITQLPTGEFFRKETRPGSGKDYGYGITGYDADGNPQFEYLGITTKGQPFTKTPSEMQKSQLDEAVKEYKKSLEKLNKSKE